MNGQNYSSSSVSSAKMATEVSTHATNPYHHSPLSDSDRGELVVRIARGKKSILRAEKNSHIRDLGDRFGTGRGRVDTDPEESWRRMRADRRRVRSGSVRVRAGCGRVRPHVRIVCEFTRESGGSNSSSERKKALLYY